MKAIFSRWKNPTLRLASVWTHYLRVRTSKILSGNDLGQLANVKELPSIDPSFDDDRLRQIIQYYSINPVEMEKELHTYAKTLLETGRVNDAWQVLLTGAGSLPN